MFAAFRDMLHLGARPLEPAALTLRTRYQLPGDIILGCETMSTGVCPCASGFARNSGTYPYPAPA